MTKLLLLFSELFCRLRSVLFPFLKSWNSALHLWIELLIVRHALLLVRFLKSIKILMMNCIFGLNLWMLMALSSIRARLWGIWWLFVIVHKDRHCEGAKRTKQSIINTSHLPSPLPRSTEEMRKHWLKLLKFLWKNMLMIFRGLSWIPDVRAIRWWNVADDLICSSIALKP